MAAFIDKGPSMNWSVDEGIYNRYKLWKQQCELLFTGPMERVNEEMQCKLLLYWAGIAGLELFNSWGLSADDQKVLRNYWERFEAFVKPQSNELMAAWELHHVKQGNWSLEEFIAKLRTLVNEANYPDEQKDRFLRDFLVFGMNSDRVRKDCLKLGNTLTFDNARDMARAEESAEQQLKIIGTHTAEVHAINRSRYKGKGPKHDTKTQHSTNHSQKSQGCGYCGDTFHPREQCPARKAKCGNCHKIGHYARVCRMKQKNTKKVHEIEANESSTDIAQHVFLGPIEVSPSNIHMMMTCKEKALLEMTLSASENSRQLSAACKIDSGAEANIITKSLYRQLYPSEHRLNKPVVQLMAYGGNVIPNLGSCDVCVQNPNGEDFLMIKVEVADINASTPVIISNITAQTLGLLKLNWPVTTSNNAAANNETVKLVDTDGKQHPFPLTKEYLMKEYKDVFTGIGCFPGDPFHIETDPNVLPIQHPPRQVPVHVQPAYESELKHLVEKGILCEVHDEYTPWVNSTVVVNKPNGKIRICLDPRDLNQAILRNPYYVRTVDDVIPKVQGATHFSILDARNGYWMVKIDEASSRLCTFNTPWGKYRWTRLPFGLTVSGDVFQEKMDGTFGKLEGISGIADDTFVHGNSEATHDQHIINILDTARVNNIKFNPDKFQFKVQEATFFGLKWSPLGLRPDEKKIAAITEMDPPRNLTEMQSFMGMINYLNRFSPILAHVSEPLRKLMKHDVEFIWQPEHQKAFQELKHIITDTPVLTYYNPEKENVIQCDASLKGLGCVLLQEGKPVYYASRSLSDAESRYSNIERELLAACWSLEKLHHYVYGKKALIETDHKPLESIWKKSIASASPRLQRLLLKMSKYDIEMKYIPGKTNVVADALSRVCSMEQPPRDHDTPMIEIDAITSTLPASPAKLDEIRQCTEKDVVLCHLKDMVHDGWPNVRSESPPDLNEYWTFREDISVENGIVLKGHRIIIPKTLRQQMLNIIHQGHLGTEKCLLKAKDSVFWPGISKDINDLTTNCDTCLQHSKQQAKEPLHPHNVPSYAWQKLGSDLLDYKGNQYLLVADYYSKFPVLRKLDSTTSAAIINHLKSIYAEYGIPETLVTDNGPQYNSREFKSFCDEWCIEHITSSPTYAQSNGFIERMVQTVKNLLKKSESAGQDPYLALLNYRTTPVDRNLQAPAILLNYRNYRTQLPSSGRLQRAQSDPDNVEKLQRRQDVQKIQYDKSAASELKRLTPGQPVVMYQQQTKRWVPAQVLRKLEEPRSYSVETPSGLRLRRNRIHLKPAGRVEPTGNPPVAAATPPVPTDNPPTETTPVVGTPMPATPQTKTDNKSTVKMSRSGRLIKPPTKLDW